MLGATFAHVKNCLNFVSACGDEVLNQTPCHMYRPEPIGLSDHEESTSPTPAPTLRSPYLPLHGKLCPEEIYCFAYPSCSSVRLGQPPKRARKSLGNYSSWCVTPRRSTLFPPYPSTSSEGLRPARIPKGAASSHSLPAQEAPSSSASLSQANRRYVSTAIPFQLRASILSSTSSCVASAIWRA